MKRVVVLLLIIILAALIVAVLSGCESRKSPEKTPAPVPDSSIHIDIPVTDGKTDSDNEGAQVVPDNTVIPTYIPGQLMCLADSQEEAEKISGLYGIDLLSFTLGVAVFQTDEDLDAVIRRGIENGWPLLEKNYISYAD